ncbi:MAG: redoxin domain-containing protein [Planctomycetes bacterium]|nr:redoxin domain-containing protein [Planctomycetota bacterium]
MKKIRSVAWLLPQTVIFLILTLAFPCSKHAVKGFYLGGIPMASAQQKRIPAPELAGGTAWFNVSGPLTLADLKGKMVLLDFWTYCCINCMHIIPDLKKLEAKYPKELVVIGVHSAKFGNERETENIRQAILRYELEHPVVADSNFAIWQAYGARSWPTLVLIDPEGYVIGSDTGEGHYEILDKLIGEFISRYRLKNLINENTLPLLLEKYKHGHSLLSFPGKVLADEASNRLFIADSNHNRIVITDSEGAVLDIAGNGEIGKNDGAFMDASFHHPQGMTLQGNYLYVADTENHLIRRLDLTARVVKTIAGTGKQADFMASGGMGISSPLNSPWDLAYFEGQLYIAMAGAHQLWVMDLETSVFQPFAGSGREGRIDGLLDSCALAQPSGITVSGTRLYFADSEVSAVRYIDKEKKEVKTVVGQDLFVFGDKDGRGEEVRLQHPLGVSSHNGLIYIADTYNHNIKELNPADNTCRTFSGNGHAGYIDGNDPQFYEPGGLSFANNKLYVADTNNHAIRVVDMKTKEVSTLHIKGLEMQISKYTPQAAIPPFARSVELPLKTLKMGSDIQLTLNINLPKGYHLNPNAPLIYRIDTSSGIQVEQINREVRVEKPELPIKISFKTTAETQSTDLKVSVSFYYCREDNQGACFIDAVVCHQPIKLDKESANTAVTLDYGVKLP